MLSLRPRGFPTVSPNHRNTLPHHEIRQISVEFAENSSIFVPIPNGCPFPILWDFVACQLPRSPSCLSRGTAASLFRRWSIGPNWKFERKARGLRKGTEKKVSQPRMKNNTDKKVGRLPQPNKSSYHAGILMFPHVLPPRARLSLLWIPIRVPSVFHPWLEDLLLRYFQERVFDRWRRNKPEPAFRISTRFMKWSAPRLGALPEFGPLVRSE